MEAIQVQEVVPKQAAQKKIQQSSDVNYQQQSSTHEMTALPQTGIAPTSVGITSIGLTLVTGALLLVITMYKKGIRDSE